MPMTGIKVTTSASLINLNKRPPSTILNIYAVQHAVGKSEKVSVGKTKLVERLYVEKRKSRISISMRSRGQCIQVEFRLAS